MCTFCPWKGGNPVRNSYRMTPKDHLVRGRVGGSGLEGQGWRNRLRVRKPKGLRAGLRARLRVWLRGGAGHQSQAASKPRARPWMASGAM